MMELTASQKKKIGKIIGYCELCNEECIPIPHRVKRGYQGGKYVLRNIMWVCKDCHKMIHFKEPGMRKS